MRPDANFASVAVLPVRGNSVTYHDATQWHFGSNAFLSSTEALDMNICHDGLATE